MHHYYSMISMHFSMLSEIMIQWDCGAFSENAV